MPSLREQLAAIREDALDFFAHPEDRERGENIRPRLAHVMDEMASVVQGARLLGPTSLSSHQLNTRRMVSALSLKRYECWDQHVTWDEDTAIGRTEAGELDFDASAEDAREIFLEAFRQTIEFLDLAAPLNTDTAAPPPVTAESATVVGSRRHGPLRDIATAAQVAAIVTRERGERPWKNALEEICEVLDKEQVKRPKTWKKKGYSTWLECLDHEPRLVKEAIRHHLKLAKGIAETIR